MNKMTTKGNLCTHVKYAVKHITLHKVARQYISIFPIGIFLCRSNVYPGFSKVLNIDPMELLLFVVPLK